VNLLRHPAWGRAQETYGEDPHHVGVMGAALARGAQRHVMACVKHFACNSIENARFRVDVSIEADVLHDVYLPHFRRVVDEGVAVVMSAYNSVNGSWCGENEELLTRVLRDQWRFDGFVISDWIYGLRDPVKSVHAGLDVEMPFRQQRAQTLPAALASGELRPAAVDRAVENVVRTVLRFDAAISDEPPDSALLVGPAHRALAREASRESMVLLKNEPVGNDLLLPIDPSKLRRVAVLGRLADVENSGDGGSSNVHPPSFVTPLAGLRAALSGVEWTDDPAHADFAVVVVGYTKEDEGEFTGDFDAALFALMPPAPGDDVWTELAAAYESKLGLAAGGDRRSLRLREDDERLIAAVAAAQPRTVVVMMGGSAIVVEPWIDAVPALLHIWYPGMEGGAALADVLLGRSDPGGRLPFAVPTDESHLPPFDPGAAHANYDGWHGQWRLARDGHSARHPFGFGLSYARIRLARATRESAGVAVDVVNDSDRAGSTVVFAFARDGAVKRLVGFQKVRVAAGTTVRVRIDAPADGALVVAQHAEDTSELVV
jgi:beta-glucosidase